MIVLALIVAYLGASLYLSRRFYSIHDWDGYTDEWERVAGSWIIGLLWPLTLPAMLVSFKNPSERERRAIREDKANAKILAGEKRETEYKRRIEQLERSVGIL